MGELFCLATWPDTNLPARASFASFLHSYLSTMSTTPVRFDLSQFADLQDMRPALSALGLTQVEESEQRSVEDIRMGRAGANILLFCPWDTFLAAMGEEVDPASKTVLAIRKNGRFFKFRLDGYVLYCENNRKPVYEGDENREDEGRVDLQFAGPPLTFEASSPAAVQPANTQISSGPPATAPVNLLREGISNPPPSEEMKESRGPLSSKAIKEQFVPLPSQRSSEPNIPSPSDTMRHSLLPSLSAMKPSSSPPVLKEPSHPPQPMQGPPKPLPPPAKMMSSQPPPPQTIQRPPDSLPPQIPKESVIPILRKSIQQPLNPLVKMESSQPPPPQPIQPLHSLSPQIPKESVIPSPPQSIQRPPNPQPLLEKKEYSQPPPSQPIHRPPDSLPPQIAKESGIPPPRQSIQIPPNSQPLLEKKDSTQPPPPPSQLIQRPPNSQPLLMKKESSQPPPPQPIQTPPNLQPLLVKKESSQPPPPQPMHEPPNPQPLPVKNESSQPPLNESFVPQPPQPIRKSSIPLPPKPTVPQQSGLMPAIVIKPRVEEQKEEIGDVIRRLQVHLEKRVDGIVKEVAAKCQNISVEAERNTDWNPMQLSAGITEALETAAVRLEQKSRGGCHQAVESIAQTAQECVRLLSQQEKEYQDLIAELSNKAEAHAETLERTLAALAETVDGEGAQGVEAEIEELERSVVGIYEDVQSLQNSISEPHDFRVLTAQSAQCPVLIIHWKTWQPGAIKFVNFIIDSDDAQLWPKFVFLSNEVEVVPYYVARPASLLLMSDEVMLTKREIAISPAYGEVSVQWEINQQEFDTLQNAARRYYEDHQQTISNTTFADIRAAIASAPGYGAEYYAYQFYQAAL